MSMEAVQAIIRKSVLDRAFAKKLLKNIDEAVRGYDLTPDELSAIKAMQVEFEQKYFETPRPEKRRAKKSKARA